MALMHVPRTSWKMKKMFYYLQTIDEKSKLSWANTSSLSSCEDKNLLKLTLYTQHFPVLRWVN